MRFRFDEVERGKEQRGTEMIHGAVSNKKLLVLQRLCIYRQKNGLIFFFNGFGDVGEESCK